MTTLIAELSDPSDRQSAHMAYDYLMRQDAEDHSRGAIGGEPPGKCQRQIENGGHVLDSFRTLRKL